MQKLFDMNEKYIETSKDFKEAIEQIEEDGGIIEIDEDKVTVDIDDIEVDEMNNEYEQLVMMFIESINGSSSKDRKSTRLNSSHVANSYAVFCLKKKTIFSIYIK